MQDLPKLQKQALQEIKTSKDLETLETLRRKYLSKKSGKLTKFIRMIPHQNHDDRKKFGEVVNETKVAIEKAFEEALEEERNRKS